jgi:hypothetical protein
MAQQAESSSQHAGLAVAQPQAVQPQSSQVQAPPEQQSQPAAHWPHGQDLVADWFEAIACHEPTAPRDKTRADMAPRKMRLIGFKLQNLMQKLKTKALPCDSIPPNSEANGDRAL